MSTTRATLALAMGLLLGAATSLAVEPALAPTPLPGGEGPGVRVERQGALAGLPSAPGPTVEKIKALGDNQWLELGAPAADPKWGKGRGRSWSCKMPYAPDLGGAFLSGQGVHGYVAPDGRYDDIFFYDLFAHRWICIYPGINTKTFVEDIKKGDFKVNDDGQVVDKDGLPIYGIGAHSYQYQTYDTDQRKWVTCTSWSNMPVDQHSRDKPWMKDALALLGEQMKGKADKSSGMPYYFDTVSGKLERPPATGERPPTSTMFYVPSKKLFWLYQGGQVATTTATGTWYYDAKAQKKIPVKQNGPVPPGTSDQGACYDTKRDRIYVGRGGYGGPMRPDEGHVFIFDTKTDTWSNPPNKENAVGLPATNYGVVNYDAANDRMIVLSHWEGKGGVAAYDPETGTWENLPAPPAGFNANRGCIHGFYAPDVNAHFYYLAHDSDDRGTMWVYRYKKAAK